MADYKELLRRAIEALPENNGTSRRAVYEKARSALVTQLRAIDPPLPAREITQHRLTLEDCIRQVEQEATEALLKGLRHDDEPQPAPAPVAPPAPTPAPEPVAEKTPEPVATPEPAATPEAETAPSEPDIPKTEPVVEAAKPSEPEVAEEPKAEEKEEDTSSSLADALEETAKEDDAEESNDQPEAAKEEPAPAEVEETSDEKPDEPAEAQPVEEEADAEKPADVKDSAPEDDKVETPDVAPKEESVQEEAALAVETEPKAETADEKSEEKSAPSVADVIAAAQAASSPKVEAPKVEAAPKNEAPEAISPALSKVVEVEVEEPTVETKGDGEEPQATIDRALKALDLEAEGKDGSDLIKEKDADGKGAASIAVDEDAIVEDEQVGGNGLTIFLVIAVLLLGGATGGAYWAWKEGFVDLEPIVEQLGLSASTSDPAVPVVDEPEPTTPAETEDQVPAQANVRDVTPTNNNNTASNDGGDRLTPEPEATPEEPTETPVETATTETAETETPAATETETTPVETTETADTGDRLQAEEPTEESAEPVLNTEDTSTQPTQVGSRSMLIEEQLTGSGGAVPFTGETTWSRDVDELGVPTIKASVSIPARNLSVDVLIRKNGDSALPASHLMEVNFSVTESFLGGGIASMPGILLKNEELAQGNPLVGASARIFDNSFLFALSAAESDLAKNLGLLSERGWIDLPVVYSTGRKAIVTIEKGTDGAEIFESVLAAWTEAQ